jgi:hypothetical protein
VYEVSAQSRVSSGAATRDWADLAAALDALARASGADLVESAEARAVARLGRALLAELSERREAPLRPLADSEQRLAALERHVAAAERAMTDLGVQLSAEQANLTRTFRERQEAFLTPTRESARGALADRARAIDVPKRRVREEVFEAARSVSADIVERFRADLEPDAELALRRGHGPLRRARERVLDRIGS